MPLALYVVSSLLLLGIIVGGVVAYLGVSRAVDGFEDENGFHLEAGDKPAAGGDASVRSSGGGAMSAQA